MTAPVSDQLWHSGAAATGGQLTAVPGGGPDGADGAVGAVGHGRDGMADFPDGQNPAPVMARGFFPVFYILHLTVLGILAL
ncbi:putative membrane protein [Citrobacter rodentium ICC168]|uniref:Membrane protein n=1 Tax=Citrobacter rodentium (strain ICC168) TaxID=637910 RepID=D2TI27_CITRI|nr:putative membrane protein [Citrobacter rodentium ICC168]